MGVEPTGDGVTRRPPVLKTGTITGPHALPEEVANYDPAFHVQVFAHRKAYPRRANSWL